MSLAYKYRPHYTVEDYLKWQGDWELIEGMPYAMASPRPLNQYLLNELGAFLRNVFLQEECSTCKVYVELDWYVSFDTVIRPDLMVLCGEIPERVESPPQMVVEIVSPSSRQMDEGLKFELCEMQGVKYFVLLYPDEKMVKVFELVDGKYRKKLDRVFKLDGCEVSVDFLELFSNFEGRR
ncbi:Uma2 family endonuclease [Pampinifervens florentissimum]|uniref:Uma2 family endonuclease n=1 Tax=Pampinifervens florentissimum TaxID=1632019 RepID=UPI0013B49077|nr:Uma2 family endonuclease [Hydrogenobacter sp. T-8]QID33848.1 Uma2 family endonuclease [Hydrogenobacter sp. T-8]